MGFTDRLGGVTPATMGSLNLGRTDVDSPERVDENFRRFGSATGVTTFVAVHQVHGTDVFHATREVIAGWGAKGHLGSAAGEPPLPIADAIVTTRDACGTRVAVMVRVADCLPVVLADRDHHIVAVAHAGRVGLLDGVLVETISAMRALGADGIRAWIGPRICGQCYEVPTEMAEEAWTQQPATRAQTSWGTPSIDLASGARAQLGALGVTSESVAPCTLESEQLHSYRRDGAASGRQVGAVWFSPEH